MCHNCLVWLSEPNRPWFKIGKLTLTIVRAIIFVIFLILTAVYQVFSIKTNNKTTTYLSQLCLFLSLIYNWRFLLTMLIFLLLIVVNIVAKLIKLDELKLRSNKLLMRAIRSLNWSQLDWPCFLRLKYFLYYFDLIHYLVYFTSVLTVGIIEIQIESQSQPPVICFFMNGSVFLVHILIELYRIIQAQRVQSTIRDIFASDFKFSPKA